MKRNRKNLSFGKLAYILAGLAGIATTAMTTTAEAQYQRFATECNVAVGGGLSVFKPALNGGGFGDLSVLCGSRRLDGIAENLAWGGTVATNGDSTSVMGSVSIRRHRPYEFDTGLVDRLQAELVVSAGGGWGKKEGDKDATGAFAFAAKGVVKVRVANKRHFGPFVAYNYLYGRQNDLVVGFQVEQTLGVGDYKDGGGKVSDGDKWPIAFYPYGTLSLDTHGQPVEQLGLMAHLTDTLSWLYVGVKGYHTLDSTGVQGTIHAIYKKPTQTGFLIGAGGGIGGAKVKQLVGGNIGIPEEHMTGGAVFSAEAIIGMGTQSSTWLAGYMGAMWEGIAARPGTIMFGLTGAFGLGEGSPSLREQYGLDTMPVEPENTEEGDANFEGGE